MKVKDLVDKYFYKNKPNGQTFLYIREHKKGTGDPFDHDKYDGLQFFADTFYGDRRIKTNDDRKDLKNLDDDLQMDFLGLFMDIDLAYEGAWEYDVFVDPSGRMRGYEYRHLTILIKPKDFQAILKIIRVVLLKDYIREGQRTLMQAEKTIVWVKKYLEKYAKELRKLENES